MSVRSVRRCLAASLSWIACCCLAPTVRAQQVEYPYGIAAAGDGSLLIADRHAHGVFRLKEGALAVAAQGTNKFRTPLNAPWCVALDGDGKVLVGDSATRDVYRIDDDGKPVPLANGAFLIPMGLAVAADGTIYVADLDAARIYKLASTGGMPDEFARVPAPRGISFDADGRLWVVSHGPDHLLRLDKNGAVETVVQGRAFQFAHNVVVDDDGTAFVTDGYAKTVWKIPAGGSPEKWISGPPLKNPVGLCRHKDLLYVTDPHLKQVFSADAAGKLTPLLPTPDSGKSP